MAQCAAVARHRLGLPLMVDAQIDQADVARPIFRLALAGFTELQCAAIEAGVALADSAAQWRLAALADADAWAVNAARLRLTIERNLVIPGARMGEEPVKLVPSEVTRPVAFGLPIGIPDIEPRCTFEPASHASIAAMLRDFERSLWHVGLSYALGRLVVGYGAKLRHGIFRVVHNEKLLALLDFRKGWGCVSPQAQAHEVNLSRWEWLPHAEFHVPEHFISTSPAELAWQYASRIPEPLLPERYLSETIHFRGAPKVPVRWFRDSHLLLLRALSVQPMRLDALLSATGAALREAVHDLGCLYFAGAITTSPAKARKGQHEGDTSGSSELGGLDLTAPAPLLSARISARRG